MRNRGAWCQAYDLCRETAKHEPLNLVLRGIAGGGGTLHIVPF